MLSIPPRRFLGWCEKVSDYAAAVDDGVEAIGFTSGDFSLIDIVDAVVRKVNRPRLVLATWTAAKSEMDHVFEFIDRGTVIDSRWIVDRSFQARQPALCFRLRELYGDEAIRVQRVHCKFVLVAGDERSVLIQTSANLNRNRRIENIGVTTCPVLIGAYHELVAGIFGTQMPGAGFELDATVTASFNALTGKKKRRKTVTTPWSAHSG